MGEHARDRWMTRLRRPVLLMSLMGCATAAWAQVGNPGFESGTLAPWVGTFAGGDGQTNVMSSLVHTGRFAVWAYDNVGTGRLSQNIATVAGATYSVSAWVAQHDAYPSNVASIRLGAGNVPVSCTFGAPGEFSQCTGSFTATGTSERLDLIFRTQRGLGVISFDDVTVAQTSGPVAVPTLSAWGLLALGLAAGGLGLRRMRRQG